MAYDLLRFAHILGAAILLGTGIGIAFFFFVGLRSPDAAVARFAARWTVRADYVFTLPAVLLQPLTGFHLLWLVGYDWAEVWLVGSLGLYMLAGACWIPVIVLQHRIARRLAAGADLESVRQGLDFRLWFWLGWPGFGSVLGIYWLMIAKPDL